MSRRAKDRIRMYYYKTKEELLKTSDTIAVPQHQLQKLLLDLQTRLKSNKFHGYYFDRACSGDENMKSICDVRGTFTCEGRWDKEKCLYHPAHSINPYVSREARIIFQTWNLDHNKERTRSIIPAIRIALRACYGTDVDRDSAEDVRERIAVNGKIDRPLNGLYDQQQILGELVMKQNNANRVVSIEKSIVDGDVDNGKVVKVVIPKFRLDVKGIYDDLFTTANLKLVHIVCHDKGAHGTRKAGPYFVVN